MDANSNANANANQPSEPLQRLIRSIVSEVFTSNDTSRSSPEELNQSFRIPRGPRQSGEITAGAGQSSGESRQAMVATLIPPQPPLQFQFNPRQNYGRSSTTRRRSRQVQSRAPRTVTNNNVYIKNIFLLPSPSWVNVPRKESKDYLQTHGLVIDAYEIDKSWDNKELIDRFNELFKDVLTDDTCCFGVADSFYK
jgi:hypothetical protein